MEPAGSTCYDWSVGQILIYPAYNQARLRNPPLTSHLVGTPRGFKCIGVDYLSLDFEANELDVAKTYNIVRMGLAEFPAGSSQERQLNILKRRYYLERLGLKHELSWNYDQTEQYRMLSRITSGNSLCGLLYTRNPESDMRLDIPSFYTRRMSTAMNASIKYKARGCMKCPKLDLGPKWWSLMVDSRLLPMQMATELKAQLRNMIIKPAICKQMESGPKELKISCVPPIKVFSNSYNFDTGIDADSPRNLLYNYSIFETYQGHLMSTRSSSVSFNWSVEQRIIPDALSSMADSPLVVLEDTFLRIDTGKDSFKAVLNHPVYFIPHWLSKSCRSLILNKFKSGNTLWFVQQSFDYSASVYQCSVAGKGIFVSDAQFLFTEDGPVTLKSKMIDFIAEFSCQLLLISKLFKLK